MKVLKKTKVVYYITKKAGAMPCKLKLSQEQVQQKVDFIRASCLSDLEKALTSPKVIAKHIRKKSDLPSGGYWQIDSLFLVGLAVKYYIVENGLGNRAKIAVNVLPPNLTHRDTIIAGIMSLVDAEIKCAFAPVTHYLKA